MPTMHLGLRDDVGFDDLDDWFQFQSRKVSCCRFDFLCRSGFRQGDHCLGWTSLRHRRSARSALEVRHLLQNVNRGKPGEAGVFRTSGSLGAMTKAASKHIWLFSVCNDLGHRRVILRVPIRSQETVRYLAEAQSQLAIWNATQFPVIPRGLDAWRINRYAQVGGTASWEIKI